MKSDIQIQKDVMEELKWEPYLNAAQIGVAVKNGIVTLSGQVDAYAKKLTAEKAAKRVSGLKRWPKTYRWAFRQALKKPIPKLPKLY